LKKNTNKTFDKLVRKVGSTIITNKLIADGDKILIGLSGGKDSYVLLEILAAIQKKSPFSFELKAVHVSVDEIAYVINTAYMQQFCEKLNIPFEEIRLSIDLKKDPKKSPCYVCSWHRRKALFNYTKQFNFNKLAFGHHMDDAIETFFLNMLYHGSISSMPYSLKMFAGRMYLIRPLLDLEKKQINEYALVSDFPEEIKKCPYGDNTKRNKVGKIAEQMTAIHKNAKKNIFRSSGKICKEYLPF
jgi:tRNA 2-thiocytidine biosynthesis protein TtcA